MKVALVYAGITESGFNSLKGNEGSWMNHGLAILSSAAIKAGHEVELFDLRRMTGWDDFRRKVSVTDAEIFGLTMMSVDFNNVVRVAEIIKEVKPGSKTVTGGPHPSICPEECESQTCFDYIVKGEGEVTFPKILKSVQHSEPLQRLIQGERLENLDEAPWADRDLFQSPEEPFVPFLEAPFVTLIAGRGCRYNCNYCQPAERLMFGKKVRRRSVGNVIGELAYLRDKFSFKSFMIHDDCLTEDPEWVTEFCEQLQSKNITQPFVAQSRADIICRNPDLIATMQNAGLRLMIIGFESGSDRVLKFLRKGCTRAENLEAARICRDFDIQIWANYMLGLPTETKEEVWETYTMLQDIKPYHCSPAFYTPHPGSDLFTMGEEMGIHLTSDHAAYRRNTYEPKIKGPDYTFLKDILYKSIALASPEPPVDTAKPSSFEKEKWRLKTFVMKRFPRLYHFLKKVRTTCTTGRRK